MSCLPPISSSNSQTFSTENLVEGEKILMASLEAMGYFPGRVFQEFSASNVEEGRQIMLFLLNEKKCTRLELSKTTKQANTDPNGLTDHQKKILQYLDCETIKHLQTKDPTQLTDNQKKILESLDTKTRVYSSSLDYVNKWQDRGRILTDVTWAFALGAKGLFASGAVLGLSSGLLLSYSRKMLAGVFLCGSIALLSLARVASTLSKGASLQEKNITDLTVETFAMFDHAVSDTYKKIKEMNWFVSAYLGKNPGSELLSDQLNRCNSAKRAIYERILRFLPAVLSMEEFPSAFNNQK